MVFITVESFMLLDVCLTKVQAFMSMDTLKAVTELWNSIFEAEHRNYHQPDSAKKSDVKSEHHGYSHSVWSRDNEPHIP